MADDSIKSTTNPLAGLANQSTAQTGSQTQPAGATKGGKRNEAITQQEFLTLLVHQLQNQDPLDPMKSEEFAVQLAQFSSLEQLIQINKKLGDEDAPSGGVGTVSSMASFLGHEVVLKDGPVNISGGVGPQLTLDVPQGTQEVRLDLIDADGQTVKSLNLGQVEAGQQLLELNGLSVADGKYDIRAVGVSPSGKFIEIPSVAGGMVEGFLLEPEPALLVNGSQVALSDVREVRAGKS